MQVTGVGAERGKECNDSVLQRVMLTAINLGWILYNWQVSDSHWTGKAQTQQAAASGAAGVPFCALFSCSEPVRVPVNPN